MNKRTIITLILAMCMMLTACGQTEKTEKNDVTDTDSMQSQEPGSESGDTLVVYFSRTGEQYTVGVIDKGNTAIVAVMIAEETGADLFEVIPDDGHDAPAYGIFSDRRVVP